MDGLHFFLLFGFEGCYNSGGVSHLFEALLQIAEGIWVKASSLLLHKLLDTFPLALAVAVDANVHTRAQDLSRVACGVTTKFFYSACNSTLYTTFTLQAKNTTLVLEVKPLLYKYSIYCLFIIIPKCQIVYKCICTTKVTPQHYTLSKYINSTESLLSSLNWNFKIST